VCCSSKGHGDSSDVIVKVKQQDFKVEAVITKSTHVIFPEYYFYYMCLQLPERLPYWKGNFRHTPGYLNGNISHDYNKTQAANEILIL